MFASPHGTVAMVNPAQAAAEIVALAAEREAACIVAGLPLDQNGEVGPQASKVLAFLEVLRPLTAIPVETIDERFTTAAAERALIGMGMKRKGRKQHVDQVAAAHILQSWLDRRAHERRRGEGTA
jgi:putative Holliday junction resolvase